MQKQAPTIQASTGSGNRTFGCLTSQRDTGHETQDKDMKTSVFVAGDESPQAQERRKGHLSH